MLGISQAPGLLAVLQSTTTPTISYLKSLSLHAGKLWTVYLIVLKLQGHRPRVYLGRRTDALDGVSSWLVFYDRGTQLPRFVQRALADGWKITHEVLQGNPTVQHKVSRGAEGLSPVSGGGWVLEIPRRGQSVRMPYKRGPQPMRVRGARAGSGETWMPTLHTSPVKLKDVKPKRPRPSRAKPKPGTPAAPTPVAEIGNRIPSSQ